MMYDFFDWFSDTIYGFFEIAHLIAKIIINVLVLAITSPIWIIPFVFWFFFERGKENDNL